MIIAIVDYRAGNLTSVKKALDYLGVRSVVTRDPETVATARKIILPGVGHFASTSILGATGLHSAIVERVSQGTPFLGICVGMQWMFQASQESPTTAGAALFNGECQRFPDRVKSPHVGWNSLECDSRSRLFHGIASGSFVYFTHSYRVPVVEATVARSEYGGDFSAAIERDHLFGVQFHPEKSGDVGLRILKTFCELSN